MKTRLPIKLANPPLVEAVLELRFKSLQESVGDLLPGLLFAALKPDFQRPETLPLGAIPREIRNARPELIYGAQVKLVGQNRSLLIGDRVVTISQLAPYEGWTSFRSLGEKVLETLKATELVSGIERFSLKTVNILEPKGRHPWDLINGTLGLGDYEITDDGLHIRAQLGHDGFLNIVEIAAQASTTSSTVSRSGVMLSVDTIRTIEDQAFWDNVSENLDKAHAVLKEIFFGLIKPDVIKEWGPTWNSSTA